MKKLNGNTIATEWDVCFMQSACLPWAIWACVPRVRRAQSLGRRDCVWRRAISVWDARPDVEHQSVLTTISSHAFLGLRFLPYKDCKYAQMQDNNDRGCVYSYGWACLEMWNKISLINLCGMQAGKSVDCCLCSSWSNADLSRYFQEHGVIDASFCRIACVRMCLSINFKFVCGV
jgi:hypothetical protein